MRKAIGQSQQPTPRQRMSRNQRRELKRQLYSASPGLEVVHANAAGIDIGNESHFVAVPPDRDSRPVREFGCFTAELEAMAEWLKSCGIETVVMQSTGVYWYAVYDILEQHGLKVFLVNARHTKNLPGRKSDVQECQWLMKLHTFGLLRNSFRPSAQIRELRTTWRLRSRHVQDLSRCIQHMQKSLTVMNIQLANVISDLSGLTGLTILRAILAGERDPVRLAEYRDPHIQASKEEIVLSLQGNWEKGQILELKQAVEAYDFYRKQMAECDESLKQCMAALPDAAAATGEPVSQENKEAGAGKQKNRKKRTRRNKNEPSFNVAGELKRIYGVDLTRIDGIDVMTSQTVLSELGTDFTAWPTESHFASWLMLCPRRDISGGKLLRHVNDAGKNRVSTVLRLAASTLLRSESYLGGRYRALRSRLGPPKAIKAMARHLACLIYRLVTRGEEYVDFGQQAYERKQADRHLGWLQRKAAGLGLALVPRMQAPSQ